MRLSVSHRTVYRFDPPMRGVVQSLRLWPSLFEGQSVIDWSVEVDGAVRGAGFVDGAGDRVETAKVVGAVSDLTVEVTGTVETVDLAGVLRGHRERVRPSVYLRTTRFTRGDQALRDLAEDAVAGIPEDAELDRAHALMHAVRDAIDYVPGETDHATTAAEALAQGRGVCQDHAHATIAAALILGLPARYVTGYLFAGGAGDDEVAASTEASHAWAEIYVRGLGWVGFDAANETCPDDRYIRLGSGFDAQDAAPIRGVTQGGGAEALAVDVRVTEAEAGTAQ